MKKNLVLVMATMISGGAISDTCQKFPQKIEDALKSHINSIRAAEYCEARKIAENSELVAVFYTAEGACGDIADFEPGTCENNWSQYMLAQRNEKIIGPVLVGGKGGLMASEIKLSGNIVEIIGLKVGENDALCCPSIPAANKFEIHEQGFNQVWP